MTYDITGGWEPTKKQKTIRVPRRHDDDEPKLGVITIFTCNGFQYGGYITAKTRDYLYIFLAW